MEAVSINDFMHTMTPLICTMSCSFQRIYLFHVFIDEHLHFHHQVKYVVYYVLRKAGTFKHGRRNLTTEARRTFYLSVCQATLDFASNAYVHCLSNQLYNRLVITSHLCMKKVFGLDRSTPTQLILSKFNLYSFEQRVNLKLLCPCLSLFDASC